MFFRLSMITEYFQEIRDYTYYCPRNDKTSLLNIFINILNIETRREIFTVCSSFYCHEGPRDRWPDSSWPSHRTGVEVSPPHWGPGRTYHKPPGLPRSPRSFVAEMFNVRLGGFNERQERGRTWLILAPSCMIVFILPWMIWGWRGSILSWSGLRSLNDLGRCW